MDHDKLLACIRSVFARKHQQARDRAKTSHALELSTMILRWAEEELIKKTSELTIGSTKNEQHQK